MPKSSSSSSKKGGGQRFLPAVINPLVPKQPSILPDPNDPLSRYAGVRGRPMEVDPAARDANPNYAKGEEYQTNCQRCIWAYEMRRRGYDVEAKPRTRSMTDPAYNRGWTTFMQGGSSASLVSTPTQKAVEKQMASWGEGARAVVQITYKGGRCGHVFIAERRNGQTLFVEPQAYNWQKPSTGYLKAMSKHVTMSQTHLMRIDNMQPDPNKVGIFVQPSKH